MRATSGAGLYMFEFCCPSAAALVRCVGLLSVRVAALEDNLRKVYSVVAMEGGVHMNSIGPAIEAQLDSIPLRYVPPHPPFTPCVTASICVHHDFRFTDVRCVCFAVCETLLVKKILS